MTRFDETVDIKNGQVDPTVAPFNAMLHIGPENIQSNTGRLTELRTNAELRISSGNYHFTPNDVLYSKIRPYLNKAALPEFAGTCSADMYPLRSKAGQFLRTYLFQMLLSEPFRKQAVSFQDRTGIPKINRAQLGSILLPRPSIAEQQDIADCLAMCDNKVEVNMRKYAALTDLFRTLLHQLMTAQVRVTDLEICPNDLGGNSVI
jgi:type I restriction enzyme S subunit